MEKQIFVVNIRRELHSMKDYEIPNAIDNFSKPYLKKSKFFKDLLNDSQLLYKDSNENTKKQILNVTNVITNYCNEQIIEWGEEERKIKLKQERELELLQSNIDNNKSNNEHRKFITIATAINVTIAISAVLISLWKALKYLE